MSPRLVFCEQERGVPTLSRGWRTPDPSPTRGAASLPGCGLKLKILERSIEEEEEEASVDTASTSTRDTDDDASTDCDRRGRSPPAAPRARPHAGSRITRTPSPISPIAKEDLSWGWPSEAGSVLFPVVPFLLGEVWGSVDACGVCGGGVDSPFDLGCVGLDTSVGSLGHPFSCSEPCKYFSKKRGCKDGANCDHCHVCEWKPHLRPKPILRVPRSSTTRRSGRYGK
jgi:hypothetical protein